MKSILVPLGSAEYMQSILTTAALLAKTFGSYIEGLSLSPPIIITGDAIGSTVFYDSQARENIDTAKDTKDAFEAAMKRYALLIGLESPRPAWREGAPMGDGFVGSYGRVFDVTVVGRPSATGARMSTLEAALFESGRPILIAPPSPPARLGETILIAWNGSTETARAIAFAVPLLKTAARVVVLTVEGSTTEGPSGDQVVRHLALNGVSSEAVTINPGRRGPGESILSHASEIGADLVVKGAYTQSRIRQMIFGGATRHIISETRLPVLMAH